MILNVITSYWITSKKIYLVSNELYSVLFYNIYNKFTKKM